MKDGKFVILCIDDDQDILQSLRMILEKNGYLMHGAPNAADGLKKFQEVTPDLVIVDLMMEDIDSGTALVGKLKAQGVKAPIYMLSSVGDELNSTTSVSALGLAGVFQKPIDSKNLLDTLKTRLKR